jgi:chemotaxis protein MotB
LLKTLAGYIRKHPDRMVIVKGYTCNLPIHTSLFPTNWELSTRRATEVVRYFINEERLSPRQFAAMGFGEYHPQFSNETEAERMKNRRVELVILSEKLTAQFTNQQIK